MGIISTKQKAKLNPKKLTKEQKQKLFEEYMVEIGQYKIVNGSIAMSGGFIDKASVEIGFDNWLTKKYS